MSRHAPGPWFAKVSEKTSAGIWIEGTAGPGEVIIAEVMHPHPGRDQDWCIDDTAHLIAAAPAMLAQLRRNRQGLTNLLELEWITHAGHRQAICEVILEIEAVIAGAEGRGE